MDNHLATTKNTLKICQNLWMIIVHKLNKVSAAGAVSLHVRLDYYICKPNSFFFELSESSFFSLCQTANCSMHVWISLDK